MIACQLFPAEPDLSPCRRHNEIYVAKCGIGSRARFHRGELARAKTRAGIIVRGLGRAEGRQTMCDETRTLGWKNMGCLVQLPITKLVADAAEQSVPSTPWQA